MEHFVSFNEGFYTIPQVVNKIKKRKNDLNIKDIEYNKNDCKITITTNRYTQIIHWLYTKHYKNF